jgi:hypothetical protein
MASKIHKKRTGKGFKISEDIIKKEEMYEEEDDDLTRHYQALASRLRTSSPGMNRRLSAYHTRQVTTVSMAHQREVDRLFAESFPNAAKIGQQMQQSACFQALQTSCPQQFSGLQATVRAPTQGTFNEGSQEPHSPSGLSERHSPSSAASYPYSPRSQKRPSVSSTPVLSPDSSHTDTPTSSHSTPLSAPPQQHQTHTSPQPLSSPHMDQPRFQSSFTPVMLNDAKLFVNIDMNDGLAGAFYSMPDMSVADSSDYTQFNTSVLDSTTISKQLNECAAPLTDYFHAVQPQSKFVDVRSRIGTPGGGEGDSWDNWIDKNQWSGLDPEQRWVRSD